MIFVAGLIPARLIRMTLTFYNQGLLVCALEAAKRLGYNIGDKKERALVKYHALFNGKYFSLSKKKQCLALDFTVGEVLYYLLFMHTLTGTGVKANQGWNAAVYAIWEERIRRGKATDAFFHAADAKIASLLSDK